jgi:hypothetical protein
VKNAQIDAVSPIYQPVLLPLDELRAARYQPHIQNDHQQGQARQAHKMPQVAAFQIKAMSFEIAKHFLNPHTAAVSAARLSRRVQVRRQQPGLCVALLPYDVQIHLIGIVLRQQRLGMPRFSSRSRRQSAEGLPILPGGQFDPMIVFFAQYIGPIPSIQLFQELYSSKFAISDHQNRRMRRYQAPHIGQQGLLFMRRTMPARTLNLRPRNRQRPAAVSNANHQQLMTKANLAPVHNQANPPIMLRRRFQQRPSFGCIPLPDIHRRIIQEATQAPDFTVSCRRARYLPCDLMQMHRFAQVDTHTHPHTYAQPRDPFVRPQLSHGLLYDMINLGDRHVDPPPGGSLSKLNLTRRSRVGHLFSKSVR